MAQTDIDEYAWEFNAPQYIDFSSNNPLHDDDDADKWFDTVTEEGYIQQNVDICADVDIVEDADAGIENAPQTPKGESRRLTRSMANTPVNDKNLPEATDKQESSDVSPIKQGPKVLSNICTNLSEWRKHKATNNKPQPVVAKHMISAEHLRQSPRNVQQTTKENSSKEESTKSKKSVRAKSTSDNAPLQGDNRKARRSEDAKSSRERSNSLRRSGSLNRNRTNSVDRASKRGHSRGLSASDSKNASKLDNGVPTVSKMPKLTYPSTPTFMKRKQMIKSNNDKVKNAEEKEMETIAFLRNEMAKKRKIAQESMKKSLCPTVVTAVRAVKGPTMPQEFQFHTDDRIKSQGVETRSGSKQKDFTRSLRSAESPQAQSQVNRGPTIPQPFSLTECRKRKLGSMEDLSNASYHSMAEKVKAFHRQTPDRFRSKPRKNSQGNEPRRGRSQSPKGVLTVPKTPQFETRSRSRPVNLPTREEIEAKEVEEMKKSQFKAHPVNQKILQNPNTGVKKVPSKPLTETEEFHLSSDRRANNSESNTSTESEKFEFHAKPVPKRILKGTVGIKPVKALPITIAKSPAFALKHRARVPMDLPEEVTEEHHIRAHPAPHVGLPFQPKLGHKTTVIEPFTFEERDRTTRARKEEKIKEMLEEEKQAREFCATRYPSPTADPLPPKLPKPATIPQPFNLSVETRGARKAEEWRNKLEEELHLQKQQASFKAKPSDVLYKEPFIPQKSDRPLTDTSEFELNTERRAMTRDQYEMFKKAKEAEIEALKRQKLKQQEEEDKKAVAKLRAELVHKSAPVKKYAPVKVQPSNKPLTEAKTPKFNTDTRLRSRLSERSSANL